MRDRVECEKVLSEHAKGRIHAALMAGAYETRKAMVTPPYMPPSADPNDYSYVCLSCLVSPPAADRPQWCSVCEDFGTQLVLCGSCRVGICVKLEDSAVGCLRWDPLIEDPKFIYTCPWCAAGTAELSQVCATQSGNTPPDLSIPSCICSMVGPYQTRGTSSSDMTRQS